MTTGIYRILNTTSGKSYVGQSTELESRFGHHLWSLRSGRHFNPHLQASFNHHGESAFIFEVVIVCEKHELTNLEQQWIDSLDSFNNGYNQRPAADSMAGFKHSDETKRRASEEAKKRYEAPEMREIARQRAAIIWANPEHVELMRQIGRKRFETPEQREAARQAQLRRLEDPEQLDAVRQRANTPERRQRLSEGLRRSHANPEVKARRSAINRLPEVIAKHRAAQRALHADPIRHAEWVRKHQATKKKKRTKIQRTLFE